MNGIRNIIFDLGGVVINIDYERTRKAFMELGIHDFDQRYSQFSQTEVFDRFDVGKCTPDEFFSEIKKWAPEQVSRQDLENAWNEMLLDLPEENLELLKQMKARYRTFLLSNTNETHIRYYFGLVKEWYGVENLDPFFEKAYYSHVLGKRKPNPETYLHILEINGLNASETLFIDDTLMHVEGARKAGLKAYHLVRPHTLTSFLKKHFEL